MNFYEYLAQHLPGAKFVDATDDIDRIKAVKSPEELDLIRRTAEMQDLAIDHLKKAIRPGRRDFEILAEAQHAMIMQGSEQQLILVGSSAPGTPTSSRSR